MSNFVAGVRALVAAALVVAAVAPAHPQSRRSEQRRKATKPASVWPSFESRHADWARRKQLAAEAGDVGPDPLTQYLVGEVIVTGVFDTDTGHGVFLFATPTGTTFFVSTGAPLYNGRLAEIIAGADGFVEDTAIIFVEHAGKDAERRVTKRVEPAPAPGADGAGPGGNAP